MANFLEFWGDSLPLQAGDIRSTVFKDTALTSLVGEMPGHRDCWPAWFLLQRCVKNDRLQRSKVTRCDSRLLAGAGGMPTHTPVKTRLQQLRAPHRMPRMGDVFVLRPEGRGYYFGRVVRTDASVHAAAGCLLVYIFGIESQVKKPPEHLSVTSLLIPPVITDYQAWRLCYFETVHNRHFGPRERLLSHCFRQPDADPPRYFDEEGNVLARREGRCGIYALHGCLDIDAAVSTALARRRARRNPVYSGSADRRRLSCSRLVGNPSDQR